MAEFLVTQNIAKSIERTINNARHSVTLISPFLQISPSVRQLIEKRAEEKTDVRIVYGKNQDLKEKELSWLEAQPHIRLFFLKDLHSKIYLNEEQAIVTSMNLYQYSQQNNHESGILVRAEDDKALYGQIDNEVRKIMSLAVNPRSESPPPQPAIETALPDPDPVPEPEIGFCVYDRKPTYYNKANPRCEACAKRQEIRNYYCHSCGNKHKRDRSIEKPACWTCYKAHFPAEAQQWLDSRKRTSK